MCNAASSLPCPHACAGVCCIFQWSDMVMGKAESWGPGDVTCLNITRCQPHQTQIWQYDIVTSHFRIDRPGSRKIVSIYGIKDSIFLIIIPHCPEAQKWFVLKQSLNLLIIIIISNITSRHSCGTTRDKSDKTCRNKIVNSNVVGPRLRLLQPPHVRLSDGG